MRCEYLPPYSPDLNPIELAFSCMKYNLRRDGDYFRMAMTDMEDRDIYMCLLRALYQIDVGHFYSWYSYCGYI
jgi:DDE superfamily endonuclease